MGRGMGRTVLLSALAGAMAFAAPAQAQFSDTYKFLEAVKKKDGVVATKLLNEPGTTVVNAKDVTTGETALHIAVARGDVTWVRFLLQRGANPNLRDKRGVTPLVSAASRGFIDCVDELIANKARLDEANDAGETPVISAVHRRDILMLRALLKAGADPDRADNSGRSARDYAALQGEGAATLAEIVANAKPKDKRQGSTTYGPSF